MVQALYQTLDRGGRKCLTVIYPKQEDGRRSAGGLACCSRIPICQSIFDKRRLCICLVCQYMSFSVVIIVKPFFAEEDVQFYKEVLAEGLNRLGAKLQAYCLMTNHEHLLKIPNFTDSKSQIQQQIGRQYGCCVNKTYPRPGTLW